MVSARTLPEASSAVNLEGSCISTSVVEVVSSAWRRSSEDAESLEDDSISSFASKEVSDEDSADSVLKLVSSWLEVDGTIVAVVVASSNESSVAWWSGNDSSAAEVVVGVVAEAAGGGSGLSGVGVVAGATASGFRAG